MYNRNLIIYYINKYKPILSFYPSDKEERNIIKYLSNMDEGLDIKTETYNVMHTLSLKQKKIQERKVKQLYNILSRSDHNNIKLFS